MHSRSLDDYSWIEKIDSGGMLNRIISLPKDLKSAFNLGVKNPRPSKSISSIHFIGMGGSAIAGEIICQKLHHHHVPALTTKEGRLPSFINMNSLCIFLSYSGNTKETISCFKEAIEKKAMTIVITSGGQLEQLAIENKKNLVKIPPGYQPRAALGLLIGATLGYLNKINIIAGLSDTVSKTAILLETTKNKYLPTKPTEKNPAKKIAVEINERLPLIYASESLSQAAANRWKNQLNENAKVMAFANVFPELTHNEIMSTYNIGQPIIIYLKNPDEKAEALIANSNALNLLQKNGVKVIQVACEGESYLEKILSSIILGDFVSTYLAIIRQVDPTPVDNITLLKQQLEQKASLKPKVLDSIE